jgi:hypothetical protein
MVDGSTISSRDVNWDTLHGGQADMEAFESFHERKARLAELALEGEAIVEFTYSEVGFTD